MIETKVTASTVSAFLLGIVAAILNSVQENPEILGGLPVVLQSLILVLVPTLVVFVGGYYAKHTPRTINERGSSGTGTGVL